MLTRRLIGGLTFVLTLFASTANEDVIAEPVRSVGNSGVHALANPTPFLCDSAQADDCFMMYISQHPHENTNMHPPPRTTAAGATPYEAVACSFELPYHDHPCRVIDGRVR